MTQGIKPKMRWTPDELAELPPVYVQMIHREHELAVERYHAKIRWAREQEKEKRRKKSQAA